MGGPGRIPSRHKDAGPCPEPLPTHGHSFVPVAACFWLQLYAPKIACPRLLTVHYHCHCERSRLALTPCWLLRDADGATDRYLAAVEEGLDGVICTERHTILWLMDPVAGVDAYSGEQVSNLLNMEEGVVYDDASQRQLQWPSSRLPRRRYIRRGNGPGRQRQHHLRGRRRVRRCQIQDRANQVPYHGPCQES